MDDFMKMISIIVSVIALTMFIAALAGGIVYIAWPYAMGAFPGLVNAGYLAKELTLAQSVGLAWVASCLIKSRLSNDKND